MENSFRTLMAVLLWAALSSAGGARPFQQAKPDAQKTTGQAETPPQTPKPSAEEMKDFQAIENELDQDRSIQMTEDFQKKYPQSTLMGWVLFFEGQDYLRKNQGDKAVEYCVKSVKADANNLGSLMIVASLMPQPAYISKNEMEKAKQLTEGEGYATHALEIIEQIQKQPNEADDAFKARKDDYQRKMHGSLGLIHLERATMGLGGMDPQELAKSEKEYKSAVDGIDKPNPEYVFRLGEVYMHEKKMDEAIDAFTKAETLEPAYKPFADPDLEQLKKQKGAAKPAGNP